MNADLTAADYSKMFIKFTMDVTMPKNLIGKDTPVTAFIMANGGYKMVAKSSEVKILSVVKPSGAKSSDAKGYVSFGVNVLDTNEIAKGAGIYSAPMCLANNGAAGVGGKYGLKAYSNCALAKGNTADLGTVDFTGSAATEMLLVNSLEAEWTLPYAIPGDRTEATITCHIPEADVTAKTKVDKDPLKIYQSSMMTKGWGTGNCFYLGALAAAANKHRFVCRNIGKDGLSSGAKLSLAFQFAITNVDKAYTGGAAAGTNNYVVQKAKTMACELSINTYKSSTVSDVNWYTSTLTMQVDGDSEASQSGRWSTFIGVSSLHASVGQHAVDSTYAKKAKDVGTGLWLFLSYFDRTTDQKDMRLFPFDTSASGNSGVTNTDLYIRNYGSALKTTATFTAAIAADTVFDDKHSLKGTKKMVFKLADAVNKA